MLVLTPFRLTLHMRFLLQREIFILLHMLSWDDQGSDPIVFDDGYGDDGVHEVFLS